METLAAALWFELQPELATELGVSSDYLRLLTTLRWCLGKPGVFGRLASACVGAGISMLVFGRFTTGLYSSTGAGGGLRTSG
ncbi:MAG: hypothetical protein ACREVK_05620 [Gammaproteobacteria bacterium]